MTMRRMNESATKGMKKSNEMSSKGVQLFLLKPLFSLDGKKERKKEIILQYVGC
jgi:hypothetical protein